MKVASVGLGCWHCWLLTYVVAMDENNKKLPSLEHKDRVYLSNMSTYCSSHLYWHTTKQQCCTQVQF